MDSTKKLQDDSSAKEIEVTKASKPSWKGIIIAMTTVIIFMIGIGGYVIIEGNNFNYEFGLDATKEGVRVNTKIDKK